MPTAPASIARRMVSASSRVSFAKPDSMSAETGTVTTRAMRAIAAIISSRGIASPSGYPTEKATPALVVAIARAPASSITRALIASHALGSTSIRERSCIARNASALARCVSRFMLPPWSVDYIQHPSGLRVKSRLMKIMRRRDRAGNLDLFESARANRRHAVDPLQHALGLQNSRTAQQQAIFLEQVGRDNQVGDPGFVLERDEQEALGRARALAHDHDAGRLHP